LQLLFHFYSGNANLFAFHCVWCFYFLQIGLQNYKSKIALNAVVDHIALNSTIYNIDHS